MRALHAARLCIALALIAALGHVVALAWVCDDAFISFRYARNLIRGLGLVYNAGERVEGYTNFSWTLLVGAGLALGLDAVRWAQVLGALCYAATFVALARGTRALRAGTGFTAALPIAALGFAAHEHAKIFATCGLETALFTLLATAMAVALVTAETPRAFAVVGGLGVLAAMTRPDGALFCAAGGFLALSIARSRRSPRVLLAYAAPFVLLYLPYFCWKWSYYGDPLPNTFYAKSGGSSWIAQGLLYAQLYFSSYYVLVPALCALPWLLWRSRRTLLAPGWDTGRAPLVLALFALPYLGFVIWVGGDFMFARFLVPSTPLLYLALELLVARALAARWRGCAVAVVVGGSLLALRHPGLEREDEAGGFGISGIGEERAVYTADVMEQKRLAAHRLKELCAGVETRVWIVGGQAALAYYAEFDLVIEGATGLTDAYLARRPLATRGRVGHEKGILQDREDGLRYLRERGVQFRVVQVQPPQTPPAPQHVDFELGRLELLTYQRTLMRHLQGRPGVRFLDFEQQLDGLIAELPSLSKAVVRAQYEMARRYYFDHNEDPQRERAFEAQLRD